MSNSKGKDLFIVDNSATGWTGLRYLEEWTLISTSFDIATGFFEIGALLALDGKWQGLDKIRILMGAETTKRTGRLLLEAIRDTATERLNSSIEDTKDKNPFLNGVPAIVDAMRSGKIECRVYDKNKFHAKAYITHAKMEVVGSQALVGSSNFTEPGLTNNIELNIQVQSAREVAQLQEWYEEHWNNSKEINEAIITTISRQTHLFTPFEVYTKALYEFFKGYELSDNDWDENQSKMFPILDRYQKEAYWALIKISRQFKGAALCDGVGLGKTFVGLMLIERLVLHEGKRVVLFAPKAAKESVWEPNIRKYIPHIGGVGSYSDFSNLAVFSHTDLGRKGEYPERFLRLAELADVVIIDEAHHFRNPGKIGNTEEGIDPSRYHVLYNLLDSEKRRKTVFMLTATPINNRLSDFRHMLELFTRKDEQFFGQTLGVNNLRAHFNSMERALGSLIENQNADLNDHIQEAQQILESDTIFQSLVVQRSRSYAKESQIRESGESSMFPERKPPQVAKYSIRKTYGRLLEMFEAAFERNNPLFSLPMYYPLFWYKGEDKTIDPLEEGRQAQVAGLIRTNFLKRFESSVVAFEMSCERLLKKLLAFIEKHNETDSEKNRFERWLRQNSEVLGISRNRQLDLWGEDEYEIEDEDIIPPELLDAVEELSREDYKVSEMINETFLDLDQIVKFLEEIHKFEPKNDDKLKKLIRLLRSKEINDEKVLIFTEFADTARYLKNQLSDSGLKNVEQVDSASKNNRADFIERFSPYYNDSSSEDLIRLGKKEIRILISTDVLSEGLNLQDSTKMVNYDIHWNPVRLMQRIGRVDRRMNPEIENKLVADHPELKASRGKVVFWNFLPPEELNAILTLYTRVTQKTLLISETLGIEGKKLLTPQDNYEALREFNAAYEGTRTTLENINLEYQSLLQSDPGLESHLSNLPGAIFSGRKKPSKGRTGVFFCYSLPALDTNIDEFTLDAGSTRWYFFDMIKDQILEDPGEIIKSIRSKPSTARKCDFGQESLIELRSKIQKHIKNSYLKRIDAPIGVKPVLKCWMEINEGE